MGCRYTVYPDYEFLDCWKTWSTFVTNTVRIPLSFLLFKTIRAKPILGPKSMKLYQVYGIHYKVRTQTGICIQDQFLYLPDEF